MRMADLSLVLRKVELECLSKLKEIKIEIWVNPRNQFGDGPLAIYLAEKVKQSGINPKTGQSIKPLTA